MKTLHFYFTLSLMLLAFASAQAQGKFNPAQVTKTLTKRVAASQLKARQALYTTRPVILTPGPRHGEPIRPAGFPASAFSQPLAFAKPSEVYPGRQFLTTNEQVEAYILAQNNRAIPNELKHLADQAEKVADHMPAFRKEAALCEQPEDQITWLVNRIGPETNYVFVGETHYVPEIRWAVSQLLVGLRQKYPQREIILLTEFLPNNFSTEEMWQAVARQPSLEGRRQLLENLENAGQICLHDGVWETVQAQNISVVGLEPKFMSEGPVAVTFVPEDSQDLQDLYLWASDEGIRIRHIHWEKRIREWRKNHPNALFVIYGGYAHFHYFRSTAISNLFPREQRVVISLYPLGDIVRAPDPKTGELTDVEVESLGWFDHITQNQFPQRTLYWQTEESAQLAGTDYQFRIPVGNH